MVFSFYFTEADDTDLLICSILAESYERTSAISVTATVCRIEGTDHVPRHGVVLLLPVWSTLIGRGSTRLGSHWSRVLLRQCLLCHKEPARSKQKAPSRGLWMRGAGSLWHKRHCSNSSEQSSTSRLTTDYNIKCS